MLDDSILSLVRAYGDARAVKEAADIALRDPMMSRSDAAHVRAVDAMWLVNDALRAVEFALASLSKDR